MIEDSIIIKGVGSFYEVLDHGKQITCKAKGSFRRDGITPLVGDRVRYEVHEKGYALTFFCVTNCWWKLGWQV